LIRQIGRDEGARAHLAHNIAFGPKMLEDADHGAARETILAGEVS
jgi:hypothetical protein